MNTLCSGACLTTPSWGETVGFQTTRQKQTRRDQPEIFVCDLFFPAALRLFVFSSSSCEGPSYLPPFKCLIREGAVLPAHQRVDGLVEALREPGVALHLRHALPTGARTPGEEVVRQSECKLEEVNRGVPQVVADQDGGEGGDAEEQHKHPDFPPLPQSHVVPDQWAGKGDGSFQKRIREVFDPGSQKWLSPVFND